MKKIIAPILLSTSLFSTFILSSAQKEKTSVVEAGAPANYYSSINSSMKGDTLKVALYNIIKGHTKRNYDSLEVDMKITDRDYTLSPEGTDDENPYMNLLYADYNFNTSTARYWGDSDGGYNTSGVKVWNKEHIWAKSNGFNTKGLPAYSDLHHLRASDWKCNNIRSNNPFANVATHSSSTAVQDYTQSRKTDNYSSGSVFEPRDKDKGDVARALFYMATRYYNGDGSGGTNLSLTTGTDSSGGKWGYLDTLLAWHELDPVDEFEAHRNDLIYEQFQHNRNPYIDHPEYARAVFKNEPIEEPDTLINLTYTGNPTKTSYREGESFNSNGLTVTATFKKEDNSTYTTNVTEFVSWSPNPLTKNTTSVTGSYTFGDVTKSITITGLTVSSLDSIKISGSPNKAIYEEGETFVSTGLSVYAIYGQDEVDVSSTATWSSTPLEKGQTSVTVTYGGFNAAYIGLLVKEKALSTNTITFADSSNDGSGQISTATANKKMMNGSDIASVTAINNVYEGKTGLKIASKNAGSLTISLKKSTYVSKIVIRAKTYSTDNTTATVSTNGPSSSTFSPQSELGDYEITVNASITTITFSTSGKQRFYLKGFDIVSGSGSGTDSITEWGVSYLHIGDSSFDGQGTGLCKSNDLYKYAKVALFNLNSAESGTISKLQNDSKYSNEYARYLAWSKACEDDSPFINTFEFVSNRVNSSINIESNSTMIIIISISLISVLAFSVLLIIKKRKHQ